MRTIVIDPGHGGRDPGAVSQRGVREKDLALQVSLHLRDLLTKAGFSVVMTRDKDEALGADVDADLRRRKNISDICTPDVFLSIHFNAGGGNGAEVYVYQDGGTIRPLAQSIVDNVATILGYHGKPVKPTTEAPDGGIYVVDKTTAPAMLLEVGYMDSSDIDKILANLNKFAPLICKAFCQCYGLPAEESELTIQAVQDIHDMNSKLWHMADADHKPVLEYINDHLRKNFEGVN